MKTEKEIIEMRNGYEKKFKNLRGRSDLWAAMRLLNTVLEVPEPSRTREDYKRNGPSKTRDQIREELRK